MLLLFSHQNWVEKVCFLLRSVYHVIRPCKKLTWKLKITNMEAENHLFELESHLPNLHFWLQNVNLVGGFNPFEKY